MENKLSKIVKIEKFQPINEDSIANKPDSQPLTLKTTPSKACTERVTTQNEIFDSYIDKPIEDQLNSIEKFSNAEIELRLKSNLKEINLLNHPTPEKNSPKIDLPETAGFKINPVFEEELDSHISQANQRISNFCEEFKLAR